MTKLFNSVEYRLIPIKGNQHYFVSEEGFVFSEKTNRCLKYRKNQDGYPSFTLSFNGRPRTYSAHKLTALTYIDNPENKPYVNHKDGNKLNNHISNLEWVTPSENIKHAYRTGLKSNKGENHPSNKVTEKEVIKIRRIFETEKISRAEIARRFGYSKSLVERIINRSTWSHIP